LYPARLWRHFIERYNRAVMMILVSIVFQRSHRVVS